MTVTFLTNEDEKKYVKTINDTAPDENGNIVVKGEGIAYDNTVSGIDATTVQGAIDKLSGGNVELDTTLTQSGKAADAKAVGDALKKKLSADTLTDAVNDALAQAKASGEFDGADGKDGYTPQKGVDYFDGKDGKDGVDGQPGKDGEPGQPGAPGYTPVKGTDYYTEADKTEMVNAVLSALPTWTGGAY